MKAKTVTYEELVTTDNYSNRKISITLEVEEGEKAEDVIKKARFFVKKALLDSADFSLPEVSETQKSKITRQIDDLTRQLKDAEQLDEEIPF